MGFSVGLFVDECLATFNFYFFTTAAFIALGTDNNAFYALFTVGLAALIANGVRPNAHFNPIRSIAGLFGGANPLDALVVRPLGQLLGAFLSGWVIFFCWNTETNFAGNVVSKDLSKVSSFLLEAFVSLTIVYFLEDKDNNNDKGNFIIYGAASLITYKFTNSSGNFIRSANSVIFQLIRAPTGTSVDASDLWFLIGAGVTGAVIAGIFKKFIETHIPTAEKEAAEANQDNNAVPLSNQSHP